MNHPQKRGQNQNSFFYMLDERKTEKFLTRNFMFEDFNRLSKK